MHWLTINIKEFIKQLLWGEIRKPRQIAFLSSFLQPLEGIKNRTLYDLQHDGRTIYLEKALNDWFEVPGYDTQNHETTKKVYIEDIAQDEKLYAFQDLETEVSFLEDEPDTEDDLFLDSEFENSLTISFIIFIPDTYVYDERNVRALVDKYRFIGKKYAIQTYTL